MKMTILFASILTAIAISHAAYGAEEPQRILSNALAVWQMAGTNDSNGDGNALQIHETVTLGVDLAGPERGASLARAVERTFNVLEK